uniref:ARID DNA-binding domain-containing protein n=1 Tax=Tanacetum cinerariifolium TaxID=118510 RepID=A0A6L2M4E2_TANCI|nr:ARID DNA-binding domain-containing protein [Tanacetum cinerariifolium]
MVNTNTFLEANWSGRNKGYDQPKQWYQSKSGKPLRKRLQQEFIKRQIRREKEAKLGKCIRQITRNCKDMLRKKLEEIELFNSSIPQDKYKKHKCFYCKQRGHVIKSCLVKTKDDAELAENHSKESAKRNKEEIKPTQPKNNYLEEYFESLDRGDTRMEEDWVKIKGIPYLTKVNTFNEFVAFLNLIKRDEIVSQEWDIFRKKFVKMVKWFYNYYLDRSLPGPIPPTIKGVQIHLFDLYKLVEGIGGYLSVCFGQEFGIIGEILAREPHQKPTGNVKEDEDSLMSHQWNFGETFVPTTVHKGKENLEHFGIKLIEDETDSQVPHPTPI